MQKKFRGSKTTELSDFSILKSIESVDFDLLVHKLNLKIKLTEVSYTYSAAQPFTPLFSLTHTSGTSTQWAVQFSTHPAPVHAYTWFPSLIFFRLNLSLKFQCLMSLSQFLTTQSDLSHLNRTSYFRLYSLPLPKFLYPPSAAIALSQVPLLLKPTQVVNLTKTLYL